MPNSSTSTSYSDATAAADLALNVLHSFKEPISSLSKGLIIAAVGTAAIACTGTYLAAGAALTIIAANKSMILALPAALLVSLVGVKIFMVITEKAIHPLVDFFKDPPSMNPQVMQVLDKSILEGDLTPFHAVSHLCESLELTKYEIGFRTLNEYMEFSEKAGSPTILKFMQSKASSELKNVFKKIDEYLLKKNSLFIFNSNLDSNLNIGFIAFIWLFNSYDPTYSNFFPQGSESVVTALSLNYAKAILADDNYSDGEEGAIQYSVDQFLKVASSTSLVSLDTLTEIVSALGSKCKKIHLPINAHYDDKLMKALKEKGMKPFDEIVSLKSIFILDESKDSEDNASK